jgi:hypothetical protein
MFYNYVYDFSGFHPSFHTSGTSYHPDICISGAAAEEFWYHSIVLGW